ncbi:DNA-binding protein [Parabacteroides sp. OttesenSCG-928-G07]|nr:DNA-binding protein [Parabacteroides sp. OttesenSCG-928-G21]MDL2277117.1 DNA-binding protein [Parabacteroides sp. OttesenSCG-928-G07]
MNYRDLLSSGANVSVTLKLEDLREIFKEMVSSVKPKSTDQPSEEFLSRKEVLNLLKIDSSTLWSWEKTGYIKSYPFGGRKRYKLVDVEAIRTGRKGVRHGK